MVNGTSNKLNVCINYAKKVTGYVWERCFFVVFQEMQLTYIIDFVCQVTELYLSTKFHVYTVVSEIRNRSGEGENYFDFQFNTRTVHY